MLTNCLRHDWEVLLPPVAKPVVSSKEPGKINKVLKVLHLSDTHWDPYYLEGSNANCGEPMCCRHTSGPVLYIDDKAGFWGDYRYCVFLFYSILHIM